MSEPGQSIDFASTQALFAAVLDNDELHPDVALPGGVAFTYDAADFAAMFAVCRAMFASRVNRAAFRAMVERIAVTGALAEADRAAFKHVRACFKHLKFAFINCGAAHAYPWVFDVTTNLMGNLQDALLNDRRDLVVRRARRLRFMLGARAFGWVERDVTRFRPTDAAGFARYRTAQLDKLGGYLMRDSISPHDFHNARKVISRFRAFAITADAAFPDAAMAQLSLCLAHINGLMGAHHDILIAGKIDGSVDYFRGTIRFPDNIRGPLVAVQRLLDQP